MNFDNPLDFLFVGLPIKAVLYAGLIRFWLRARQLPGDKLRSRTAMLVLYRIGLGLLGAIPLFMFGTYAGVALDDGNEWGRWPAYLVLYGSIRFAMWAVIATQIARMTPRQAAVSPSGHRLYHVAGVLASFLGDVPTLLALGGPIIGKLYC